MLYVQGSRFNMLPLCRSPQVVCYHTLSLLTPSGRDAGKANLQARVLLSADGGMAEVSKKVLYPASSHGTIALAMSPDLHDLRIIRRAEVLHLTGLSRATLYRLISENLFPTPVRLSATAVGWRASAIRKWLEAREPVASGADELPSDQATRGEE